MRIRVERFNSGSDDTLGRMYINGRFVAYTLEDEKREVKVKGETRIPSGTYKIGFYDSPSHGPKSLHIKDVHGFEYILIHPGNTDKDTDGCLLVGKRIGKLDGKRAVLDSKLAFKEIYPIIAGALDKGEEVEIKYMDIG